MNQTINPEQLKKLSHSDKEYALIDVREEGVFSKGHLFHATPLALSQLELHIRRLVPRFDTPVVVMDGGDGLAVTAAEVLGRGGYDRLSVMSATLAECAAAGFEIFEGVNVPSKAFGEFVELACHTPHVPPAELKASLARGDDVLVLDSRPFDEYAAMHIPGAISCPSQELLYRFAQIVPRATTTIVVNCAGRTRSIIGAQSLINGRVPNRVVALENGTMGWRLAGFELEHGEGRRIATQPVPAAADVRTAAARIARESGVRVIDRDTLAKWRGEQERHTLYVFDVRPFEEYVEAHLPDAIPIEGVQLVQKTDGYVAVRNARVVVTDNDGVRARLTAAWLAQMGLGNVAVLDDAQSEPMVGGPYRPTPLFEPAWNAVIEPTELARRLPSRDVTVIDLSRSLTYKARHIPGAWFAIRARLAKGLQTIAPAGDVVLTSDDGILARFAASTVEQALGRRPLVLAGGNKAWLAAGLPVESGMTKLADPPEDAFWRPYELEGRQEAAMEQYLSWEQGVVEQVKRDGLAQFRPLTPDRIWAADD